jgi:hypothetical protein
MNSAQNYAAELKRRIGTKPNKSDYELYVTGTVLGCDLGKSQSMPLVAWMHFNPLGPTNSALFYIPVPGIEEGLLTFRSDNPFRRQHAAFGVMPHDVAARGNRGICVHAVHRQWSRVVPALWHSPDIHCTRRKLARGCKCTNVQRGADAHFVQRCNPYGLACGHASHLRVLEAL